MVIAIIIASIPKTFPLLELSGPDKPFKDKINNIEDYHRMKNSFHEFKPSYPGYDFIIPRKNINKTIFIIIILKKFPK